MIKITHKEVPVSDVVTVQNSDDDINRRLRFTISSEKVDRDYDKISLDGWQFDNFLRNPVVLWGHDQKTYPIGKVVELTVESDALKATVEFAPASIPVVGPEAEAVYQLLKQGFLSATSVGFSILDCEISDRMSPSGSPGLNITRAELAELSIVNIPSNSDALIEQRQFAAEKIKVAADIIEPFVEDIIAKTERNLNLRRRNQHRLQAILHSTK